MPLESIGSGGKKKKIPEGDINSILLRQMNDAAIAAFFSIDGVYKKPLELIEDEETSIQDPLLVEKRELLKKFNKLYKEILKYNDEIYNIFLHFTYSMKEKLLKKIGFLSKKIESLSSLYFSEIKVKIESLPEFGLINDKYETVISIYEYLEEIKNYVNELSPESVSGKVTKILEDESEKVVKKIYGIKITEFENTTLRDLAFDLSSIKDELKGDEDIKKIPLLIEMISKKYPVDFLVRLISTYKASGGMVNLRDSIKKNLYALFGDKKASYEDIKQIIIFLSFCLSENDFKLIKNNIETNMSEISSDSKMESVKKCSRKFLSEVEFFRNNKIGK